MLPVVVYRTQEHTCFSFLAIAIVTPEVRLLDAPHLELVGFAQSFSNPVGQLCELRFSRSRKTVFSKWNQGFVTQITKETLETIKHML
jgi:hypothetical protein